MLNQKCSERLLYWCDIYTSHFITQKAKDFLAFTIEVLNFVMLTKEVFRGTYLSMLHILSKLTDRRGISPLKKSSVNASKLLGFLVTSEEYISF